MGDAELGVELGRDEGRLEAGEDDPVDRARVDVALDHDPRAGVASARQVAWLPCEAPLTRNQLRRAPHASAASRWACWNGGVAGRRRCPRSRPGCRRSNAARAERVDERRVRSRARPCGPGTWKRPGSALRVVDERVEVRGSGPARCPPPTQSRLSVPTSPDRARRPADIAQPRLSVPLPARPCGLGHREAPATFLPSAAMTTTTILRSTRPHRRRPAARAAGRAMTALFSSCCCSSCCSTGCSSPPSSRSCARGRARLEELAERARAAPSRRCEQLDRIDEYLAACQVGITMASIGIGFLGEPALAHLLEPVFGGLSHGGRGGDLGRDRLPRWSTSIHITVGEQVPKMLAITRAEEALRAPGAAAWRLPGGQRAVHGRAEQALERDRAPVRRSTRRPSRSSTPRRT